MNPKTPSNIFWFRRDLRLNDNTGLFHAIRSGLPVLPLFIFDTNILSELEKNDPRISFIHQELKKLNDKLAMSGSRLLVMHGEPLTVWKDIVSIYHVSKVFLNHDDEPYARKRDQEVKAFLESKNIGFESFKDQVIFERDEVLKEDGKPYTVYTPYMNKWMKKFTEKNLTLHDQSALTGNYYKLPWQEIPDLRHYGFVRSYIRVPEIRMESKRINTYHQTRDFPSLDGTSLSGPHLRFGTVSIRELISFADSFSDKTYLKELIWREFFMQILYHFPQVTHQSFKPVYDKIAWINNEEHFKLWCEGKTGYPLVDAGMRELNATGFMHNRVRMVTASFLVKHLLIDWRWGEAYFAKKLLDFELSSNNGNWQWAAGTGCDAAPYFRIFNPEEQMKKFDPEKKYIRKWIPELGTDAYPKPVIDHKFARVRALETYRKALV